MPGRTLIIEDDDALRALLERSLRRAGWEVTALASAEEALPRLMDLAPEVVLTDLNLLGQDGLSVCRRVADALPGVPVVVMTAFGSMDTAVEALRAGAWDFLSKPLDLTVLGHTLQRALEHGRLRAEVRRLRERLERHEGLGELVGESPAMRAMLDLLARVAPAPSSVLITGESGTGKELVARALHKQSGRDGAFVAINCAAVPAGLLESELFGHVKGAFTDARTARAGLFVQARGGTLFLDEVGDMPAELQPKLLRVLQERRVRPVGGDQEQAVDVRVVSATNRDLEEAVRSGRFREDLLYRLDVIRLELPPLRARGRDVLLLAQAFLSQQAEQMGKPVRGIAPEAARLLLDYDWPGNVRELQNCVERAVVLARLDHLTVDDLPPRVRQHVPLAPAPLAATPEQLMPLEALERRYVAHAMKVLGDNKALVARTLGIDRRTLYRMLERWDGGEEDR
ncbi:MAG: sigma-54 dependent transcriptional regulator [Pseudomonadota bacterium]